MDPKKQLIGEVSLEEMLDRLSFSEEETARAAMEQSKLFMAAASYRVKKMRAKLAAERDFDNLIVDKSIVIRQKLSVNGKPPTERTISEQVDVQLAVREAKKKLDEAKSLEEWAKLLVEAYGHRRDSLKVLVQFAYTDESFRPGKVRRLQEEQEQLRRKARMGKKFEEGF